MTINKKNRGFSIIELMIAMSLFVIIISVTVGIFIRTVKTQKIALLLIEANDNLASVVEQLTREIRVGTNFRSSAGSFEFINARGQEVRYQFSDGGILKGVKENPDAGFTFQKITADSIEIKRFSAPIILNFPNYSPRIIINISASAKGDVLRDIPIDVQTTVSARALNL